MMTAHRLRTTSAGTSIIPAYDDPAVVSCMATDFALDCTGQTPMPDTVRFGIVSIDDNCRGVQGATVTVALADDTTAAVTWSITDDDSPLAFTCPARARFLSGSG